MNDAFSLSISVVIIAFGIWIAAGGAGSPLAWMLIGLLPVIVGTISLYLAIREVKVAQRN